MKRYSINKTVLVKQSWVELRVVIEEQDIYRLIEKLSSQT